MGCFDYHCAITNVSIRHNDPVLHVVVLNDYYNTAMRIYERLCDREIAIEENIRTGKHLIAKGVLIGDFPPGQIEEDALRACDMSLARAMKINFGTYNDYGWIEEVDSGDLHPMSTPNFMIKREVVERIYKESGATEPMTPVSELKVVALFMDICRINPFYSLSGMQHYDQKEHEAHLLRVELIKDALGRKEQYWRDLDDESVEEGD